MKELLVLSLVLLLFTSRSHGMNDEANVDENNWVGFKYNQVTDVNGNVINNAGNADKNPKFVGYDANATRKLKKQNSPNNILRNGKKKNRSFKNQTKNRRFKNKFRNVRQKEQAKQKKKKRDKQKKKKPVKGRQRHEEKIWKKLPKELPKSTKKCGCCGAKNSKQMKLQKCIGCKESKQVYYCGKKCQKIDWKKQHREHCAKSKRKQELADKIKFEAFQVGQLTDVLGVRASATNYVPGHNLGKYELAMFLSGQGNGLSKTDPQRLKSSKTNESAPITHQENTFPAHEPELIENKSSIDIPDFKTFMKLSDAVDNNLFDEECVAAIVGFPGSGPDTYIGKEKQKLEIPDGLRDAVEKLRNIDGNHNSGQVDDY
eukprot:301452_1